MKPGKKAGVWTALGAGVAGVLVALGVEEETALAFGVLVITGGGALHVLVTA